MKKSKRRDELGVQTDVPKRLSNSERLSDQVKKYIVYNRLSDNTAESLIPFDHITQNKLAEAIIKYKLPAGELFYGSKAFQSLIPAVGCDSCSVTWH